MFRLVFLLIFIMNSILAIENCTECHNIENFEPINHNFSCIECHILPEFRDDEFTHDDVITHPASNIYVEKFCGDCHKEKIVKFKSSNHYTHYNEINTIFKTFGIDSNYTLQTLPKPPKDIKTKEDIVTDMLRRKCLMCHTENRINYSSGMYHGKGCMACHTVYRDDGKYAGSDKTIKKKKPFAKTHTMQKANMKACLSCHNKEFVGGDYIGFFPKDYDKSYRAPLTKDGKFPQKIFGTDHHILSKDVHFEAGMDCVDCHKKDSILGEKKVSCKDCHDVANSHDKYHDNLSCTACHATWQMSHYELSLLRDDTKNYEQWANLTQQEDGYLERFLNLALKDKSTKPVMYDYINSRLKEGVWYSGWRFRRWEHLLLGKDENGTIQILRPFFQYKISYKNRDGEIVFNNFGEDESGKFEAFIPYTPHTIGKSAKSCEACHENIIQTRDFKGKASMELFKGKILKGYELNEEELKKLNSDIYKKERAKILFKNSDTTLK